MSTTTRSTPTCVGKRYGGHPYAHEYRVHPHVRGEECRRLPKA